MGNILLAAGILCLLYFIILLIKRVDFCLIWLPAGIFFLLLGGYMRYCVSHPDGWRLPGGIQTVLGVLLVLGLAVFLAVEGMVVNAMLKKPRTELDYIIVLGAQVKGSVPSLALTKRLEAAVEYLEENPQTAAVLSGGQGDGEDITEARCMYEYLTQHGITADRLLLEERSTSTMENLRFSAEEISKEEELALPEEVYGKNIGLLSNNFHVYRASLLAEKMGYRSVDTIAAHSDWRLQVHYLIREFFALVKEKISGNI